MIVFKNHVGTGSLFMSAQNLWSHDLEQQSKQTVRCHEAFLFCFENFSEWGRDFDLKRQRLYSFAYLNLLVGGKSRGNFTFAY